MKPYMMAIAGGSGSGKTTILNMVLKQFPSDNVLAINQDNYYRDLSHLPIEERKKENFDHPMSLDVELLHEHIHALSRGESIEIPQYDFSTHTRLQETKTLEAKPIIIFDGIFSLYYLDILECFNIKVYVDVDNDVRFIRRLTRDINERGRTMDGVVEQYMKTVRPMHNRYIAPSKANADIVLYWEKINEQSIDTVVGLLEHAMKKLRDDTE